MEKERDSVPLTLTGGNRRDSELFEEGLVDAAWIPAGFAFQSLGEFRSRQDELEEYAVEQMADPQKTVELD